MGWNQHSHCFQTTTGFNYHVSIARGVEQKRFCRSMKLSLLRQSAVHFCRFKFPFCNGLASWSGHNQQHQSFPSTLSDILIALTRTRENLKSERRTGEEETETGCVRCQPCQATTSLMRDDSVEQELNTSIQNEL